MNDNQDHINLPNLIPTSKDTKNKVDMPLSNAAAITAISLLTAIFYSICFTGTNVYPMLSFFIFNCAAIIILYNTLNKLNYLTRREAFFWSVPIIIISLYNTIFSLGFFSYTNVIIIHILFAVMGYNATHEKSLQFSKFTGWIDIVCIIISNIFDSFNIFKLIAKNKMGRSHYVAIRVIIGIIISVPVLIVIMAFLLDADAIFKSITYDIFNSITIRDSNFVGHAVCILIVFVYLLGYVYNLKHIKECTADMPAINLDVIIGSTFLIMINLMFLFFCVVQMTFLFTGGYMKLPEGIIYADYAREGFFQLLFVTIVNFGLIIMFLRVFPECTRHKLIKLLLITLSVFTGILICSSLYRMNLYISAYGYTDIRMMVITFLVMEMVCIFITLYYLFRPKYDFLKQYMYIGLVFYMLVNITASQYFVSRLNVNRFYNGFDIDINQFRRNPDSISLLIEVTNSDMFHQNSNAHTISQANEIVSKFQEETDDRWQNWSLLKSINRMQQKSE